MKEKWANTRKKKLIDTWEKTRIQAVYDDINLFDQDCDKDNDDDDRKKNQRNINDWIIITENEMVRIFKYFLCYL